MKKYFSITLVFLLILLVLTACELSWAKPELSFSKYNVEEESEDGSFVYDLTGTINNSGASGKYELLISVLPLMVDDEVDNWIHIDNFGPYKIDTGDTEFESKLRTGLSFRVAKVKMQLFSISSNGKKEFVQEAKIHITTLLNPVLELDSINVDEEVKVDEYIYEISGIIRNSGGIGRYKIETYGLPIGLDYNNPDNWRIYDNQKIKVIQDDMIEFNYVINSSNSLEEIAIILISVDDLEESIHDAVEIIIDNN